jgi:4-amino-4-deoxy-L-arabinose transferase-like glycosyltransferase
MISSDCVGPDEEVRERARTGRLLDRIALDRWDFAWLLAIGILGLGLRLIYVTQYTTHPLGRVLYVDEIVYWERAQAIVGGSWLPDRPFYQDPLIHYVLAGLMNVVGKEVPTLRLTLACLGALTPVVTYFVGRRGLGRAEAIIAGFALALYGPLVFTDGQLEKEGLGALVVALALLATTHAITPGRGPFLAALAGSVWGAATLLRANALLVAPIGVVWWLICPRLPFSRRSIGAISFLAGFALAIAPVTLINAMVSRPHEFILTTWQGGAMFYTGNGPGVSGTGEPPFIRRDPHVEADDFAAEAERRAQRPLTPSEVSSFWMGEGLRRWREAPVESLGFFGYKLGLLLGDVEVPDSQSPDWVRLVAAPGLGLAFLSFGWLTPWAALGLARGQRTPFWWFLVAATAAGLISTAAFFVLGRYRVPWAPCVALLAAAGVVDLARRIKVHRWVHVAASLLLLAAPAAFFAWRPGADPDPDRWGYFELALIVANLQAGDLDAAIDALDDARAADPHAVASAAIAGTDWVHDQWKAAVGRAWAAASNGPERSLLRFARLARVVPETHGLAQRMLDEAERTLPDSPALWRERGGWWLGRQHEDGTARQHAADAFRHAWSDPSARIELALLTSDLTLLDRPPPSHSERARLARAIIDAKMAKSPKRRRPAIQPRGTS